MPQDRPNVLLLVADDQRFDTIAALGNDAIATPNYDRLVRSGTALTRAHNMGSDSGAVCVPARSMIHSGRSLFNLDGPGGITEAHPTLGEAFGDAGYRTFGTGKWHNGMAAFDRSFEEREAVFLGGMGNHWNVPVVDHGPAGESYDETPARVDLGDGRVRGRRLPADRHASGTHSTELFADATIDFVQDAADGDAPFFAYCATMEPHDPRTPPGEYLSMYDHERIDLPENFATAHPFDNGELDVRDEKLARRPRDPEEIRRHIADYYASITHLDHHIGRVLDALEATGQREDTVVAFTADHGLAVGRHGLMGKQNLYDHSVRVPLLISGPAIPEDERRDALRYQYELYPTLHEVAGLPVPDDVDARSLLATIRQGAAPYEGLCCAYKSVQRMARDDRYKLIEYGAKADRRTQLFDLHEDPHETENLADADAYAEVRDRLRERLLNWCETQGDEVGWLAG
jgi:arylsulfatase A-like enzyme